MKKILTVTLFLLFSTKSFAGFYDWKYFEATTGCLIGGAIGYSSAPEENKMATGAAACAGVGLIIWGLTEHYDAKYGDQFLPQEEHLDNRIQKYKMLGKQKNVPNNLKYFRKVQRVLPPRIDETRREGANETILTQY